MAADGSRVVDALRFGPQAAATSYGRTPDGADDLRPLAMWTPGAPNAGPRLGPVVINEIHYRPVSGDEEDEFVEVHNRSAIAVDLSGWRFTQGIDWTFSSGTTVAPGGYLVVARDAVRLLSRYPALTAATCVGDYRGGLDNGGELLRLSSPETIVSTNTTGGFETNLVYVTETEVKYADGGQWGVWSDGLGSSLELVNSGADPMRPSNWADSDETEKGGWTVVEFTGLLEQGNPAYAANQLQLFMLGVGECLVDDVEAIGPSGSNAIGNPGFDQGLDGWVPQGSFRNSYWQPSGGVGDSGCLHVVAESRGDTGVNRIRTILLSQAGIRAGEQVTLRAKVRWLRGWPEFLLRIRGNYLEATGRLDTSVRPGTPGVANSTWRAQVGPAIWNVRHDPVLPQADRPVVVSAQVQDPDGIASVQLRYRVDPSQSVNAVAMRDDGTQGDALAADGVYSAVLPGQPMREAIAFSVVAADSGSTSAETRFPSAAPQRECLVRFGETAEPGSYAAYRIWMTSTVRSEWTSREKLNNSPLDVTFVLGNQRVIYNVRSLYAGSPFISPGYSGPTGTLCGYVVRFPEDDRFLGVTDVNLDWPTRDGSFQLEQLAYWMMEELGLPRNHRRFIRLYVDGIRRGSLYEDVQQPSSEVVAQYFPDDRDGDLFKIEDWFEFDDSGSGFSNRDATLELFQRADGTKNRARYRWNWRKRAVTDSANDYTSLFALSTVASTPNSEPFTRGMDALVDMREWLGIIAVEHIVGNWDSFGYNRGKNMYAYKPERGKWALLAWDIDFVLGASSDGPFTPLTSTIDPATFRMFYSDPGSRRTYYRVLKEAMEGPLRLERFQPRLAGHAEAFTANFFGRQGSYPSSAEDFILQRATAIQGELAEFEATFQVTAPASTTTQNTVILQGEAPLDAASIAVNEIIYPVQWLSSTYWVMTVPLQPGMNTLEIAPLDSTGKALPRTGRSFQVNYTGTPSPPEEALVFNEIMHHPSTSGAEYIELYNASPSASYDLSGWRLSGLDYTFPPGSLLEPQGYAVLAKDLSAFVDVHGAEVTPLGAFDGNLVPTGETLRLVRPGATPTEDVIVQQVSFESRPPWPQEAVDGGVSLQLQDSRHSLNRIGNWASARDEPLSEWRQVVTTGVAQTNKLFVYFSSWPVSEDLLSIEGLWDGYLTLGPTPQLAFQVEFEPGPAGTWLGYLVYGPGPNDRDPIQEVVVEGGEVILNFDGAPGLLRYTLAPSELTLYGSYNPPGEPSAPSEIRRSRPGGNVYLDDITLVQGTVSEAGQSLVVNGDFETGVTTPWATFRAMGSSSVVTWTAHGGEHSLAFESTIGGIEDEAVMSQVVDGLQVGETYTLSFWWRPGSEGEALVVRLSDWSVAAYTELVPFTADSAAATPGAANSVARQLTVIPALWINELQLVNLTGPADAAGDREPWVELYNAGSTPLDLSAYGLSLDAESLFQWTFPGGAVIQPGEFRVVWLDGEPDESTAAEWHAAIRSDPNQGLLMLNRDAPDGPQVIDYLRYAGVPYDGSVGWAIDGDPSRRALFTAATPLQANTTVTPLQVLINEWMASNNQAAMDPADGDYEDWFELYNPGAEPADLSGYLLSDSAVNPGKAVIPDGTVIPGYGYLLVWADREVDQNIPGGDLHVDFKLDADGDVILLSSPDGSLIDGVSFVSAVTDIAEGRWPDGALPPLRSLKLPSPGGANLWWPEVRFLPTQISGDLLQLRWISAGGLRYQVQYSETLDPGNWYDLGEPQIAVGSEELVELPRTPVDMNLFYRLRVIP